MLNFEYKGISQGKYVEGEIEALNNTEAAHLLKEQKVIITKLIQAKKKKDPKEKKKGSGFSFGSGVKAKDVLIFAKQFATMLKAGLPVLNTLNMLLEQTSSPNMKKIIEKIKKDLENGSEKIRVGIRPEGKIIARENTKIFSKEGEEIGIITSGTFGPSVNSPVAMGYVKTKFSEIDTNILLEVRGNKYAANVAKLPFYKKSYVKWKRGNNEWKKIF